MSKTQIGLIGFGAWGRNIARVFNELGVLDTICESDPQRYKEARDLYPHLCVTDSESNFFSRKNLHGIAIACPAPLHLTFILKALAVDKHVFVEKPLALSVQDGQIANDEAKKRGKILLVGHILEYHPAFQKLKELARSGELGAVQYIYSHRLNWGRFRIQENSLWDIAPHDISILTRLMDGLPCSVSCFGHAGLRPDKIDSSVTILDYPGSVQAHIFVSWLHPFKVHRFVVIGDKQMAVFDDTADWEKKLVIYPRSLDWLDGDIPVAREAKGTPISLMVEEPLKKECLEFVRAIENSSCVLTDGDSGVRVLKVLQAAQTSMELKGTPVYL